MLVNREMNPLANLPYIVDGDTCVCQTNAVRAKRSQRQLKRIHIKSEAEAEAIKGR